jgi:hypothetical protein
MTHRLFRLALLTALLGSWLGAVGPAPARPAAAQTGGGATYFIDHVNAEKFPQVEFNLRALDLNNKPINDLTANDFTVFESDNEAHAPGRNLQVTPHDDGPITYVFLVDLGASSNYVSGSFGENTTRLIFQTLIDNKYFRDGVDTAMVIARQNIASDRNEILRTPTKIGNDLAVWAASFPFKPSGKKTKVLEGVSESLDEIAKLAPPGSQATHLIVLTRYIEEPPLASANSLAADYGQKARQQFTAVHILQTDPNQYQKAPLEALATTSHGLYVALQKASVKAQVDDLYRTINAQRRSYAVSYASQLGSALERQISLDQPMAQTTCASAPQTCFTFAVQAPKILILNQNEQIERLPRAAGAGFTYDPDAFEVEVQIAWPDSRPRPATLQLFFGQDSKPGPKIDLTADEAEAKLEVDISDFETVGSTALPIRAQLTDQVGLTAEDEVAFEIVVVAPPTPTPTVTPIPPPTPAPSFPASPNTLVVGGLICVGLLGVGAVIGGMVFVLRSRTKPSAKAATPPPTLFDPQNTLIGGVAYSDKVLATLQIIEGPKGLLGEPVNLTKPTTVIGRHPQRADITFYPDEESSVSRVHCTIQLDGATYKITDNSSTSGTRVNGERLAPNDPRVLHDGDEIVLGDLAKRGIKARFNIISAPGGQKYGATSEDRTIIIGTSHDDDQFRYDDK